MGRRAVVGWILFSALTVPAGAFAQTPAGRTYGGGGGNVQEDVVSGGGVETVAGPLPFTGVDLAVMVGAAIVLIAVGLTVRRAARARA